jgi:CheY-like chemotaxis protein
MEARRNLENVYKRRLEEAEKKKFQLELQLELLKVYLSFQTQAGGNKKSVDSLSIIVSLQRLEEEIKQALQVVSRASSFSDESIWQNSVYMSKLEFDLIEFNTESIFLGEIVIVEFDKDKIRYELSKDTCINTDLSHLRTILIGFARMIKKFLLQPTLVISYDAGNQMLQFNMSTTNEKLISFLGGPFDTVDSIISRINANVQLDEVTATMFLCKGLAQSMGGDIEKTENGFKLSIPCDILPGDKCPVPFDRMDGNVQQKQNRQPELLQEPLQKDPPPYAQPHFQSPIPEHPQSPIQQPIPPIPVVPITVPIKPEVPQVPEVPVQPVAVPVQSVPVPVQEEEPLEKKKKLQGSINLLLVEDNTLLQRMFVRAWKGHNVFTASTGPEALDMFKTRNFHIIFLDIEIPQLDGIGVAKEMRAWEQQKGKPPTPIIGMSGSSTKQYKERGLESGMNDFIYKGAGYPLGEMYNIVLKYTGTGD